MKLVRARDQIIVQAARLVAGCTTIPALMTAVLWEVLLMIRRSTSVQLAMNPVTLVKDPRLPIASHVQISHIFIFHPPKLALKSAPRELTLVITIKRACPATLLAQTAKGR